MSDRKSPESDAAHPISISTHWLTRQRLRAYPVIFLFAYLIASIIWLGSTQELMESAGKSADFIAFWAASHLSLNGQAADAYNLLKIHAVEQQAVAGTEMFGWFYPPTFLLLVMPLASVPYPVAYTVFTLATLALFIMVMRKIAPLPDAILLLLAFPGTLINLMHGQNAFLTASLVALAMIWLTSRPLLAGMCIGLLTVKPHLALLPPIALLCIGAWRPLLAACGTILMLILTSTLVFGMETWRACMDAIGLARQLNENGALPWHKMPSMFATAKQLGASQTLGYMLHACLGLSAVLAMIVAWRNTTDVRLRGTALAIATLMLSPHLFDYDTLWYALPIAWLTLHGMQAGWHIGDREILVAAWLYPLVGPVLAEATNIQIAPLLHLALLFMTLRRVFTDKRFAHGAQEQSCHQMP